MTHPSARTQGLLQDLLADLAAERSRLEKLLLSLVELQAALERDAPTSERVDAAALRLLPAPFEAMLPGGMSRK